MLTVNLEEYPTYGKLPAMREALKVAHPEHQKYAFWWALEIMRTLAGLDGAWIDERNSVAVLSAKQLVKFYDDEVVGVT